MTLIPTAIFVLCAAAGAMGGGEIQGPRPTIIPANDAPTLGERVGKIEALTLRYYRWRGDETEHWDVFVKDRQLLERIERMRRSEWREAFFFNTAWDAMIRVKDTRYAGRIGDVKVAARPFGLYLVAPDGRWSLFVATQEAARELHLLLEQEALKQIPEEPIIQRHPRK